MQQFKQRHYSVNDDTVGVFTLRMSVFDKLVILDVVGLFLL